MAGIPISGVSYTGGASKDPLQRAASLSGAAGVSSAGSVQSAPGLSMGAIDPNRYVTVADPSLGATSGSAVSGSGAGGTGSAALLAALRSKRSAIDEAYNALFSDLDTLLKARAGELDTQYGDQLKKAGQDFADVLPTIDQSFAALGSYDSTQRGDNRAKAQKGYEDTVKTIGSNKEKDMASLGQLGIKNRAEIQADREAANRYIDSAANTTDENALREANNNLDTNLSKAKVTRATLVPGASASQSIKDMTADNGRFQSAIDSLDAIFKSSMPDSVKQAALTAVTTAGGLSDEEKKKAQVQYGNVYAEQSAL